MVLENRNDPLDISLAALVQDFCMAAREFCSHGPCRRTPRSSPESTETSVRSSSTETSVREFSSEDNLGKNEGLKEAEARPLGKVTSVALRISLARMDPCTSTIFQTQPRKCRRTYELFDGNTIADDAKRLRLCGSIVPAKFHCSRSHRIPRLFFPERHEAWRLHPQEFVRQCRVLRWRQVPLVKEMNEQCSDVRGTTMSPGTWSARRKKLLRWLQDQASALQTETSPRLVLNASIAQMCCSNNVPWVKEPGDSTTILSCCVDMCRGSSGVFFRELF